MSYVNQDSLKMQKRRHGVRQVSPEEAIQAANEVVDKANNQIARYLAYAQRFEQVARDYEQENAGLIARAEALEKENAELRAEVERLRRKIVRKSGKRKGEEWEEVAGG